MLLTSYSQFLDPWTQERKQPLLTCFGLNCTNDKHQFYLCGGRKLVILLDIKIGLPYTHLQREIRNRPSEGKMGHACYCVY